DQAVAMGAAIQASQDVKARSGGQRRLAGAKKVQDVMSHSLGMIALNNDRSQYINSIIIPKNNSIPTEMEAPFTLRTRPGNTNICEVYITQGESDRPSQCVFLGKYVFSGIAHDRSGAVTLGITYAYDQNGVVNVSATDQRTRAALAMTVEP